MHGLQPDLSQFPRLLASGKTKREIAERASASEHFKLVEEAYQVFPSKMQYAAALYFVVPEGQNVCKIGIAHNPFKRLHDLRVACWLGLSIKALFWYPSISVASSHEYQSLRFAKENGLRLRGEWVDLDYMEAIGLALTACPPKMQFTDNYGLIHDWFVEVSRQTREAEDEIYSRRPSRTKAA